ncbi:hypothetical protein OsI_33139 [Oryza sativa Indica Group]|uniref:MgtC/SapB/SrpB/YhiD N-terminal domain-containing protein n=2 Tax=cellular organisms TaxID=131567 RepID=B8BGB1_ORYSI|nr:hypothetical protein OsI_33139 [Oryza sativa Indica Group]
MLVVDSGLQGVPLPGPPAAPAPAEVPAAAPDLHDWQARVLCLDWVLPGCRLPTAHSRGHFRRLDFRHAQHRTPPPGRPQTPGTFRRMPVRGRRMTDWWEVILATTAGEFSDLPDLEQATRIVVRLGMAGLLGGLLGWEREHRGKAAGVRTHMLVSMGAALFVLVAEQEGIAPADNSRVLQGIIAGVGFLGAGTILKSDGAHQIRGLTTAAGIWLTAAIGVAAGLGREATALLSTLMALLVLAAEPLAQRLLHGRRAPVESDAAAAGERRAAGGGPPPAS